MVLNLCMPHFQTTIQCNKLCADGYDVSNLLSGDPLTRRRGFKLEYFLRPPFHVTLSFQVKMELCRVDVELWPWGMDQGRTSRRLEILSCPDPPAQVEPNLDHFKLVARYDLQDEVQVCFLHPTFKPRAPFPGPPPQVSAQTKRLQLWSRGPQSLSSVSQLRVSVPYSGAATALGIRSLSVWGLPAHCCSSADVERIREAHRNSLRINPPSAGPTSVPPEPDQVPADSPLPEEFLDPLTQELMVFPMILPSGMVIDQSTLDEYQKREATWGRLPNDPFTGVPFTQNSKPLPNPVLKGRIDRLRLRTGCTGSETWTNLLNKPHASRLVVSPDTGESVTSTNSNNSHDDTEHLATQFKAQQEQEVRSRSVACARASGSVAGPSTEAHVYKTGKTRCCSAKRKYESSFPSSRADSEGWSKVSVTDETASHTAGLSLESHEERLADSLDRALDEALHGLPIFTSESNTQSTVDTLAGQLKCLFCACSLTAYSSSVLAYALPCGHLQCGSCLRSRSSAPQRLKIKCPVCGTSTSTCDITRVHH